MKWDKYIIQSSRIYGHRRLYTKSIPAIPDKFIKDEGRMLLCKALVTYQNGVISVKSAGKDQGTTMLISLDPVKGNG